jgi:hypothetical protein
VSERSDPRKRPSDPAGTQPKFDPASLEPASKDAQLALTAGAPAAGTALPPADDIGAEHSVGAADADLATPAAGSPSELLPERAKAAATPALPPPPQVEPPHAARFQFLFGALGALGVAAVGLAAVLLSAPGATPEKPWSAWRPANDGTDPAQQIANFVAPQYRLDDGKQIVQVSGGPPALKGQPLTLGVVKSGAQPARLEGNSVLFQMCGGGTSCSIKSGKPSQERGLLLSREALELALYTFRYVSGVDQVIVTIPPPPPSAKVQASGAAKTTSSLTASSSTGSTSTLVSASHALMFRPQDIADELDRPIGLTLSAVTPRVSEMDSSVDAPLVRQLTDPRLYDFIIDEVPQSGPVLLLEPPGLGG